MIQKRFPILQDINLIQSQIAEIFQNKNQAKIKSLLTNLIVSNHIQFPQTIMDLSITQNCIRVKANNQEIKIYSNGRMVYINQNTSQSYQVLKNGSIYFGQIENKKPNGEGVFKWNNGESYSGQWLNAQKHGFGQWNGLQGDYYIGQWINGQQDGLGEHKWKGDVYFGQWKNSVKNGYGVERFQNGDLYIGNYFYGKPQGNGEYRWKNGSVYQGQFLEGMRNGFGKWKSSNGITYEGEFQNDVKNGAGRITYQDGTFYHGEYVNDMKDGFGVMELNNGTKYEGQWKKNQFLGFESNCTSQVYEKISKSKEFNSENHESSHHPSKLYKNYMTSLDHQNISNNLKQSQMNNPQSVRLTLKQPESFRANSMNASRSPGNKSFSKNRKSISVDLQEIYLYDAQRTIKKQSNKFKESIKLQQYNNKKSIKNVFVY